MMRALKPTDVKKGSVIAFMYNEKGRYKQVGDKDEETGFKYMRTVPVGQTPKIRTLKIEKIQEEEKKDKTLEIVGYKVRYGTYGSGFNSSKQTEFLSVSEMDRILCHARLIQL